MSENDSNLHTNTNAQIPDLIPDLEPVTLSHISEVTDPLAAAHHHAQHMSAQQEQQVEDVVDVADAVNAATHSTPVRNESLAKLYRKIEKKQRDIQFVPEFSWSHVTADKSDMCDIHNAPVFSSGAPLYTNISERPYTRAQQQPHVHESHAQQSQARTQYQMHQHQQAEHSHSQQRYESAGFQSPATRAPHMQTQLQTQPQQQPTFAPTYTSAPTAASTSSAEPAASTLEMNRAMKRNALTPRPYGKAAEARPPKVPLAPAKKMQAKFNPLVDFPIYLVIFLGGMIGTALRYGLALLIPNPVAESGFLNAFHTATFIANMCASFILAFTSTYLAQAVWIRKRSRTLVSNAIGIGMCGGFSTMSTFAVENMKTLDKANYAGFFFYTIVTFVCGIVLCWLASHWAMHIASKRSAHKAEDSLHQSAQPLPAVGGVRVPSTPLNNVDADDDDADYGNYTDAREREYDHERKLTREHVTSSQFAATRAGSQTQSSSMQPSAATISYDAVPSASAVHYGAVPAAAAAAAVPTAATTDSGEAPIIDATPERLSEVTREATEHRLQLERQHQQAQAHMQPPAFEPDPITDELELVADANTGEVH